MAWDTARTKASLLSSAISEFSKKGAAGARIDEIARAASVNKERIYQYFGKKESLFNAVLVSELQKPFVELTMEGQGPHAVGEYAGRLFDLHVYEPATARLLFWEGLEMGQESNTSPARGHNAVNLLRSLLQALPGIDPTDAGDLLTSIWTLCSAWGVLPQVDALFTNPHPDRMKHRREHIVRAAVLLSQALEGGNRVCCPGKCSMR